MKKSQTERTDARSEDRPTRSRVEAFVVDAKRRGRVVPAEPRVNSLRRMNS